MKKANFAAAEDLAQCYCSLLFQESADIPEKEQSIEKDEDPDLVILNAQSFRT